MQWLNALKVAIIEEEYETLSTLCEEVPAFDDINDMKEAQTLIHDAILVLKNEQKSLQESMCKIKKNSVFLSQENKKSKLSTLT